MYSYRILQNWREDTFHSSLLTFEKHSYLFNCSDGTQRNALDQGVKFSKIKFILFNSSHSECYLGSFGLLMSRGEQLFSQVFSQKSANTKTDIKETAYSKKNKIKSENNFIFPSQADVFGPPMFSTNYAHSRLFCPTHMSKHLYDLNYQTNSFINPAGGTIIPLLKDENITIIPICVNKGDFANKNEYALSFIIIPSQKNPPFLADKAKSLGLKPGPAFSKLQKGESVLLDNGTEIKPEMVLGEAEPASSICIFYMPSIEYMKALISNPVLLDYLKDNNKKKYHNTLVVHIVPNLNIINNSDYKKFIELFGKDNLNIVDCKETTRKFMYNEGKIKIKKILNYVNPTLFSKGSFTYEDTLPVIDLNAFSSTMPETQITESIPGSEYILFPLDKVGMVNRGLNENEAFYPKSELNNKFSKQIEDIILSLNKGNSPPLIPMKTNTIATEDNILPRITFLGTTSMKPCKFRNVTSIMIHLPHDRYILFDCGEGTYQQLLEHNGLKKTNEIMSKTRAIAISHKHGDHMLGLIKILNEVDKQMSFTIDPLLKEHFFVIVPKTIIDFVKQSISSELVNKSQFIVIESSVINPNEQYHYQTFLAKDNPLEGYIDLPKEKNYLNVKERIYSFTKSSSVKDLYCLFQSVLGVNLYSIEVFHCDESFGYFIEAGDMNRLGYFKISFSGDTRPNNNFFNYAMNSTVLIHEGTFDDEMTKDAIEKMHSTIGEAIALGKESNCKRIIITHFSPRYIKCYPYKEVFEKEQILLAHDYLSVSIGDLDWAYLYLKPFDKIITTIEEKEENIL